MTSTIVYRFFFSIFCFLLFSFGSHAQSDKDPQFQAKIEDLETGRKIDNVIIEIYKNGKLDNTVICDDGKFLASFEYDNNYEIKIGTNTDYITKIVEYDTRDMPQEVIDEGNLMFTATISLFKKIEGLNAEAFEKPIAKIAYAESQDDMYYDEDYTRQVYGEQNKVVEEYKKMLEEQARKEAAKQKNYQRLMKIGLKSFTSKEYVEAKGYYEQALDLYPEDINALKKIKAIDEALKREEEALALQKEKEIQSMYDAKIKEADKMVLSKSYTNALALLNEANTIIPNHSLTVSKINEVNDLINQEKQLNANYTSKLQEAEAAMVNKNYKNALKLYKEASILKPNENLPKDQISSVELLLDNIEEYNSLMANGDAKLIAKEYEASISVYEKALELVPNDDKAKKKILEAKEQIAILNTENDKIEQFNNLVKEGDVFFDSKDFDSAIASYNKALVYKQDVNVEQKIKDSKSQLEAIKLNQSKEQEFQLLVEKGQKEFESKDFKSAKSTLENALKINDDKGVQSKLDLINELILKGEEQSKLATSNLNELNDLMSKAEDAIDVEDYEEAISLYEQAKNIPSSDKTLIDNKLQQVVEKKVEQEKKIAEKNTNDALEAQNKITQQNYTSKADNFFKKGNYSSALKYYEKASALGVTDYLSTRISETNQNLSIKSSDVVVYTSLEKGSYEAKLIERLEAQKKQYNNSEQLINEKEEENIIEKNMLISQQKSSLSSVSDVDSKVINKNNLDIAAEKKVYTNLSENVENDQIIKENDLLLSVSKANLAKQKNDNEDKNTAKNVALLNQIENGVKSSNESINDFESGKLSENSRKLETKYKSSIEDNYVFENDLLVSKEKKNIEKNQEKINQENKLFIKEKELLNERYQDSLKKYSSNNDPNRLKNNKDIEQRKLKLEEEELIASSSAVKKRIEAEKLLNSNEYKNPVYSGNYKSKLANEFPEGKTQTIREVKNDKGEVVETLTRVVVVKGNLGNEYTKTESKWGEMYLKNGKHITKNTFQLETTIRKD